MTSTQECIYVDLSTNNFDYVLSCRPIREILFIVMYVGTGVLRITGQPGTDFSGCGVGGNYPSAWSIYWYIGHSDIVLLSNGVSCGDTVKITRDDSTNNMYGVVGYSRHKRVFASTRVPCSEDDKRKQVARVDVDLSTDYIYTLSPDDTNRHTEFRITTTGPGLFLVKGCKFYGECIGGAPPATSRLVCTGQDNVLMRRGFVSVGDVCAVRIAQKPVAAVFAYSQNTHVFA